MSGGDPGSVRGCPVCRRAATSIGAAHTALNSLARKAAHARDVGPERVSEIQAARAQLHMRREEQVAHLSTHGGPR